jgi:glycosyltransferase involved in cell wall biosynthesis
MKFTGTCRPDAEPIYLEVTALLSRKLTGIGRYVARMLEALCRLVPLRLVTTVNEERARSSNLQRSLLSGKEIALEAGALPAADDVELWVRQLLRRPQRLHDGRQARLSAGVFTMPRPPIERHFRREICLLYDFTPAILPWAHLPGTCEHYGLFFTQSSGSCDRAIAISRSTQADARWLCPLPPERVLLGYPGPSLCVHRHGAGCDNGLDAGRSYRRHAKTILVVAMLEPRKNCRFLFDWFLDTDALPADMELHWVGPQGWLNDDHGRVRRGKGDRRLCFRGMVSDAQLCQLYQQAAFTIYPSLYEGFGFPVLDSLWHGTQVLCSLNSSLQEFDVPGVFFFDPCDPASLDAAYCRLRATGPAMVDRQALRERFSWDRLARTVIEACA